MLFLEDSKTPVTGSVNDWRLYEDTSNTSFLESPNIIHSLIDVVSKVAIAPGQPSVATRSIIPSSTHLPACLLVMGNLASRLHARQAARSPTANNEDNPLGREEVSTEGATRANATSENLSTSTTNTGNRQRYNLRSTPARLNRLAETALLGRRRALDDEQLADGSDADGRRARTRLDDAASFSFFFRYRDEPTATAQAGQSSPTSGYQSTSLVFVEVRTAQRASAALMEFSIFFLVPRLNSSTASSDGTSRQQQQSHSRRVDGRIYDQARVINQAMRTFQQLVMASSPTDREDGEEDGVTEDDLRRFQELVDFLVTGQQRPNVGLDSAQLGELKEREWREADGARCTICLEPFGMDDKLRLIPCRHAFHTTCLDAWLRRVNSCPLCRLVVVDLGSNGGRMPAE